jgi:hypothetical protein
MISTPNAPGGLFESIEKEPEETCIYKRVKLDYTVALKIYIMKKSHVIFKIFYLLFLVNISTIFFYFSADGVKMHITNITNITSHTYLHCYSSASKNEKYSAVYCSGWTN